MEDEEVSERAIAESSAAMRSGDGARVSPDCGQKSGEGLVCCGGGQSGKAGGGGGGTEVSHSVLCDTALN